MQIIQWYPGVVVANTNIDLPSEAPEIDAIVSAQLVRCTSFQIDATATAADMTTFVGVLDGSGAEISGARIGHAGGAGEDIPVPAAFSIIAATATKVDGNTIKLNVDTQASDLLVLKYVAVGERVKV